MITALQLQGLYSEVLYTGRQTRQEVANRLPHHRLSRTRRLGLHPVVADCANGQKTV